MIGFVGGLLENSGFYSELCWFCLCFQIGGGAIKDEHLDGRDQFLIVVYSNR